jgi:hypothetical protein
MAHFEHLHLTSAEWLPLAVLAARRAYYAQRPEIGADRLPYPRELPKREHVAYGSGRLRLVWIARSGAAFGAGTVDQEGGFAVLSDLQSCRASSGVIH